MARSKDSGYIPRHERHVARNGHSEQRYGLKKMGAGTANWGVLGDEIPDVHEIARADVETNYQHQIGMTKLNLVDSETFQTLRWPEQQS